MPNNISVLDQLATFALDGTEKARGEGEGAVQVGRWAVNVLRTELPDIDEKEMGAVLLVFSSLAATIIDKGSSALGVGNLAAMTGAYFYTGREL